MGEGDSMHPHRWRLVVAALTLCLLCTAAPVQAGVKTSYSRAYWTVAHHISKDLAGKNIRRAGIGKQERPARAADYRRAVRRLKRIIAANIWKLRRDRLSSATVAMLNRLGGCETRGIPYPQNYQYRGAHDGRYQYLASTWQRAGGRGRAYQASPAEQDVRTAWFYPSHRGEWACSG